MDYISRLCLKLVLLTSTGQKITYSYFNLIWLNCFHNSRESLHAGFLNTTLKPLFFFFSELWGMWCHLSSTHCWPLPCWLWWLPTGPSPLCILFRCLSRTTRKYIFTLQLLPPYQSIIFIWIDDRVALLSPWQLWSVSCPPLMSRCTKCSTTLSVSTHERHVTPRYVS